MYQDHYINVNGIKTRFWREGTGMPLVLVHGIGASAEYWEFIVPKLAEHFEVIVLDMPGFGKSDKPDVHYDLPFFAKFLNDFISALGLEKIFLAGHSLGGALCLQFCVHHKEKVERLFLLNNAGFSRQMTWVFRLMSIPFFCRLLLYKNRLMYAQAVKLSVHKTENLSEEFLDRMYEVADNPGHKHTVGYILQKHADLCGMKRRAVKPLWKGLKTLHDLPVFVVWGEKDRLLNIKHLRVGKKRLPHAQSYVFKDCGHIPMIEYPAECAKLMIDFFEGKTV